MRLSEQLANAMVDAGHAEEVVIFPGQLVVVRSVDGDYIGQGFVEDVDEERGLVRVRDNVAGTDVQYDVDTSRYTLWVKPPMAFMTDPTAPKWSIDMFVKASNPVPRIGQ